MGLNPLEDISYFELLFLISVCYFADKNCNYVILECGLGGELDATNSISHSEYTVVTKIGMDHTKILGDTISKITDTKIRIVRPNNIVIMAPNQPYEAKKRIEKECAAKNSLLYDSESQIQYNLYKNNKVDVQIGTDNFHFNFPLNGYYQSENLKTVLMWYKSFTDKKKENIDNEIINSAFKTIDLIGRFEKINENPLIIVDVAHNIDGIRMFKESLETKFCEFNITIVMGFLKDKDVNSCCKALGSLNAKYILTEPANENRSMSATQLSEIFQNYCNTSNYKVISDPISAIKYSSTIATDENNVVFVIGSFYLVKEIRKYILENKNYADSNKKKLVRKKI